MGDPLGGAGGGPTGGALGPMPRRFAGSRGFIPRRSSKQRMRRAYEERRRGKPSLICTIRALTDSSCAVASAAFKVS